VLLFNIRDSGRVYVNLFVPVKSVSSSGEKIDGKQVLFKIDTGADITVMDREDFKSLGFSDEDLIMNSVGSCKMTFANGSYGLGHKIMFDTIMLGGIVIHNFEITCPADVVLTNNLIGLDFLNWFVTKRDPGEMKYEMTATIPNKRLYSDLSWNRISVSELEKKNPFESALNLF
jgi:clan AA aspartic protease (TIGR02281 family)